MASNTMASRLKNYDEKKEMEVQLLEACKTGDLPNVKKLCRVVDASEVRDASHYNYTPLLWAARNGHTYIVQFIVQSTDVDINCTDIIGATPLHEACRGGHLDVVKCLIQRAIDVNVKSKNGFTPLHCACRFSFSECVSSLLEAGADPNCVNKSGVTPISLTINSQCILLLLKYGANPSNMYKACKQYLPAKCPKVPEEPAVSVFIVGNTGAGKSTLTESVKKNTSGLSGIVARVSKVSAEKKTAGITPHTISNRTIGKIQVYDLAGDEEFYSSHDAIISTSMSGPSSAVFILVVDLQMSAKEIKETIQYWLNFLQAKIPRNHSQPPHLLCVGSHFDLAGNAEEKNVVFESFIPKARSFGFEVKGFIAMNCQYAESDGMRQLRQTLSTSYESLRLQESMTFHAHCFHVFLLSVAKENPAIQLNTVLQQSISCHKTSEKGVLSFLPTDLESLCSLSDQLSERNLVLFFRSTPALEESWIIVDQAALLSRVNGTLFAGQDFRTYRELATSTGVVPLSKITLEFKDLDSSMITQYLTHLHFCTELNQETLKLFQPSTSFSLTERYFLFPSLVRELVPADVWVPEEKYIQHSGWEIECSNPEQFFTPRFLHLFLLRIAFRFALSHTPDTDHLAIHRSCSIWKNGISWESDDLVSGLVEISNHSRKVTILVRCQEKSKKNLLPLLSSIMREVLETKEEVCHNVTITEYILPSEIATSFPIQVDATKLAVSGSRLIDAIVLLKPGVLNVSNKPIEMTDLLLYDTYMMLDRKILNKRLCEEDTEYCQLIPRDIIDSIIENIQKSSFFVATSRTGCKHPSLVRQRLLQMVGKWGEEGVGTYRDLRHILHQYGVMTLLAVAGVDYRGLGTNSDLSLDDNLKVSEYLIDLNGGQLETLGRVLGLSHATVTNYREHDVATYRKSLVTAWLNKQDNVMEKGAPSWSTLVNALRSRHLRQNGVADKITREKLQSTQ